MSILIREDPADRKQLILIEFQGALNVDPQTVNGATLSDLIYNETFKVDEASLDI